jgi:acetoacetyl-CoA synthetase
MSWDELLSEPGQLAFEQVPFDHPMCVLFSSGTTGLPKAIVHGHGGLLIEHYKNEGLCWDLKPGDRLCWFSTTGWMMWNTLVSGLLLRASIVMVDGNPAHPDLISLWRLAEETNATHFGAAPAYIIGCRKAGLNPGRDLDLSNVRQVIAGGSPLPTEGFAWVYEQLPDVLLNIGTGGTDVCSGIAGGGPLSPVYAGELTGRYLAVATDAYDEDGRPVLDELGELVITEPMPSMPVGFWNDPGDERYRSTYFEMYPGVWRHGDWVRFTSARGSCVVTGRSDATLNRGGVRLGTSELYAVVEDVEEIVDSMVIHLEDPDGGLGELILFVVPAPGVEVDDDLRAGLVRTIRTSLSPRHVPDRIEAVPAVPRTLTGKKLEVPVKRILQGADPAAVANRDSLADPSSLERFVALAAR